MQSSGEAPKPLKIERQSDGKTMIIWLIGRIRAEDLAELKKQIDDSAEAKALDLSEITIVNADVIRFLSVTERKGTPIDGLPSICSRVDSAGTSRRRRLEHFTK
jgi:hypothetical protein